MNKPPSTPDAAFWKRKLAAFLHDCPSKALDIRTHEERAAAAYHRAGFQDNEIGSYDSHADHTAAAADRIPFPQWRASGLTCAFDGIRNAFRHPLGGPNATALPLPYAKEVTLQQAEDIEQNVQPAINAPDGWAEADVWRARFFAHWRFWGERSAGKDHRMAFLPADTRIPDHTIWNHMTLTAALDGCRTGNAMKPAFIKFQIGPVQDFIAQSRSFRDLWSGSFLLSWLMAHALKEVSALAGPDAVIFPNLLRQPLFDFLWTKELWQHVGMATGSDTLAAALNTDGSTLRIPNLPNVFLALVPADRAIEIAQAAESALRREWSESIAPAVWKYALDHGLVDSAQAGRYDRQVDRFLSVAWQALPWSEDLNGAAVLAGNAPIESLASVEKMRAVFERKLPLKDRDGRYYTDGREKTCLNNRGIAWAVFADLADWQLNAVRATRAFDAWGPGRTDSGNHSRDVLNGRDEAVAGGPGFTERLEGARGRDAAIHRILFKHDDWVGAATLVKRLLHIAYLEKEHAFPRVPMPDTRLIAEGAYMKEEGGEDSTAEKQEGSYLAVIAFDGDEIGKWVSGAKSPPFRSQLADYEDAGGIQRYGAVPYFEREAKELLEQPRPVSPAYHLQFSEALSNFALRCVRPIVESNSFCGRLIYAGGDDVLAILPADKALACAAALRAAFRGDIPRDAAWAAEARLATATTSEGAPCPGFLVNLGHSDGNGTPIPFLVPGPRAEVSAGIAIAHFKNPIQDVVRAAQGAEKRAKRDLGRAAVAVTLCKRSGETIEWGCRWKSGGLDWVAGAIRAMTETGGLSSRFPHKLIAFIEPYLSTATPLQAGKNRPADTPGFDVRAILMGEVDHVLSRDEGGRGTRADEIHAATAAYLDYLKKDRNASTDECVRALIGAAQTAAFLKRHLG